MENLNTSHETSLWLHTLLITGMLIVSMLLPSFQFIFRLPVFQFISRRFPWAATSKPFAFLGIGAMLSICFIDFIPELFEAGHSLSLWVFSIVLVVYAITHLKHYFQHLFKRSHSSHSHTHLHAKYEAKTAEKTFTRENSDHQFCSTHLDQLDCRTHLHDNESLSASDTQQHIGHEYPHQEKSYYLFLISMTIHCFSSGLLLGSSNLFHSLEELEHLEHSIFFTLLTHKAFEGFLVASIFNQSSLKTLKKYLCLGLYVISFPLAVALTQILPSFLPLDFNIESLAIILSSVAGASLAGCLIFDFLLPNVSHLKKTKIDIAWLLAGAALAHFILEQTHHHHHH